MAKKKDKCPECCTHTISFSPKNCELLWDKQLEYKKSGKKRSIEFIVNEFLGQSK